MWRHRLRHKEPVPGCHGQAIPRTTRRFRRCVEANPRSVSRSVPAESCGAQLATGIQVSPQALSTLLGDIATSVWSRSRRTVRSGLLAVVRNGPRTTQLPGALAHDFRDSDLLRPGKRCARPLPGRLRLEQLLQFRSHRGTSRQTVSSVQPIRAERQARPIPLASRRSLPARPESADGPWPDRR